MRMVIGHEDAALSVDDRVHDPAECIMIAVHAADTNRLGKPQHRSAALHPLDPPGGNGLRSQGAPPKQAQAKEGE